MSRNTATLGRDQTKWGGGGCLSASLLIRQRLQHQCRQKCPTGGCQITRKTMFTIHQNCSASSTEAAREGEGQGGGDGMWLSNRGEKRKNQSGRRRGEREDGGKIGNAARRNKRKRQTKLLSSPNKKARNNKWRSSSLDHSSPLQPVSSLSLFSSSFSAFSCSFFFSSFSFSFSAFSTEILSSELSTTQTQLEFLSSR